MADNVTVDNVALPDYDVRTTETSGGKQIQHMRLDLGSGSTESVVVGSVPVTSANPTASSATLTNVSASASSTSIVAANSSRKGLIIFNDSSSALYIKFGTTASTSSFTYKIFGNGTWEMPETVIYTGAIDGIWDSATGAARVTEL